MAGSSDFGAVMNPLVNDFVAASTAIGEPLTTLAQKVQNAIQALGQLVYYGMANAQPDPTSEVWKPLSGSITEIVNYKQREDLGPFTNHVACIRESIVALGWMNVPKPMHYIRDMKDAGDYYGNRVRSNFKGQEKHMKWIDQWGAVLTTMKQYVASNCPTGFVWGAKPGMRPPMNAGPPPPPPPPPPAFASSGDDAHAALLKDLNIGSNITSRLKHVDKSSSLGPAHLANASAPRTATVAKAVVHPPKIALEGRKWLVEHVKNNHDVRIENEEMSQSLSVFQCDNSSVVVNNKMNSAVMDNCKRVTVVVHDIISSVEAIRCDRLKIQCIGHVPLINLDSCDSAQIFISENSRDVEIISSKSNSCNVCLLEKDGDYKELPIPEQIKTVIVGKNKLESCAVEKN